jgi:nitrate/TMAO reductase-like tetraheme cytochrome c subunit
VAFALTGDHLIHSRAAHGLLLALLSLAVLLASAPAVAEEEEPDSCVDCHSNPDMLVTNKKLYDYFERWTSSIHKQEGVTCVDCHGGNPRAADKRGAHATADLTEAKASSAVNFRNIPDTCGDCHEEILESFRKSAHFEHVVAKEEEDQGPTCVTCHGSINVAVLNVNTVEATCSRCHNEESENHPDTPEEARALLNRFLSIHRYYRYITVRGDPLETRAFFELADAQIHSLSVTWHSFDLDKIREETEIVLAALKEKRQEVGRQFKERRQKR